MGTVDFGGTTKLCREWSGWVASCTIFWCRHWAMRAPRHLSGFYCILMFSSWPCHPQDVFPSPLIRLTSCSCFKDTNSVGCTSDHGLSHLPVYSLDSCVPEARGLHLSWISGTPKFPFLFSENCSLSKTGLKVVPSLEAWQGQTCAICFCWYYLPGYFKGWCFTSLRAQQQVIEMVPLKGTSCHCSWSSLLLCKNVVSLL